MKKNLISVLPILLLFSLSACANNATQEDPDTSSNGISEVQRQEAEPGDNNGDAPAYSDASSVNEGDVKESNSLESEHSDDNSWDYISSSYPLVTYDDVKAGEYNNQYVILPAIIESTNYSDRTKQLECDVWFSSDDSYICANVTFDCMDLQEYPPTELAPGDNIDACFLVNRNGSFKSEVIAYCPNENPLSLEDVYSCFSENPDLWNIDFEYHGAIKNDVTRKWRLSKVNTDFEAADYALYYYNRYFQSDDEIHFIVNYNDDTTIRIKSVLGMLDVGVLSHIDGEENDAKIMASGDLLQSFRVNIKTGEIEN